MQNVMAVALGGALGALGRYFLMRIVPGAVFPWGTLAVNVIGSFILAVLVVLFALKYNPGGPWRLFLVVGALGAFTTFSAFSLDTFTLFERGEGRLAALYVLVSVAGALLAFGGGVLLARRFFS